VLPNEREVTVAGIAARKYMHAQVTIECEFVCCIIYVPPCIDFQESLTLSVNDTQVLLIPTVYSKKVNAFYTRHEGEINVVDMA
jgi:hypothetical protein